MRIPRPRPSPASSLGPPRPATRFRRTARFRLTARLRLTLLYGAVCLVFGAALLTTTYLLSLNALVAHPVPAPAGSGPSSGGPAPHPVSAPAGNALSSGGPAAHPVSAPAGNGLSSGGPAAHPVSAPAGSGLSSGGAAARANQPQSGIMQISFDREQLLVRSAVALVIVSVAAVGAGWLLAGRVLRPLSTITAAARRISASSLNERLGLGGPDDELKELGDTLDDLFARLEAAFDAQRRFAANASHELRTPLTRERTLLQVTRADPASTLGTWQTVSTELLASNAEQERLIEALLTLASSEGGLGEREPVDLAAITTGALAAARPGIGHFGLRVHTTIGPAVLNGDPLLIQRLASNLIDNAIRHNAPGGEVQIGTRASGPYAVLSVTSTGPVIPPAEVERLFQPFQRFGPRRARRNDGHGLGLSIVRAIATAHGATITASARPGGGLAIEIAFPAAPRSRAPGPRAAGAAHL